MKHLNLERLRQFIDRRRYAYTTIFNSPQGQIVLADLMEFCRANESTFNENEAVSNMLDGRREVFLRIQQHVNLSPDDLFHIATGQAQRKPIGE